MTKNVNTANSNVFDGLDDLNDWRTSIVALSWTEVGLFAFLVVSGLARWCTR